MSKAHRGKGLKSEHAGGGRGDCPVCKRGGVKIVYEVKAGENKIKICKECNKAVAHGKKQDAMAALA